MNKEERVGGLRVPAPVLMNLYFPGVLSLAHWRWLAWEELGSFKSYRELDSRIREHMVW